jgi:hypothetical protein
MTEVNPRRVQPSQDFLKEKTTKFILECIKNGEEDQLPPTPILRKDDQGQLVAIDGHNLLAVMAYFDRKVEVHIAENNEDGLPATSEANIIRNQDLKNKFESCLDARDEVQRNGVHSFRDLLIKYPELFEGTK